MLKRQFLHFLNKWYLAQKRKPLLLRGARQVGKSTLVRMFAQERGLQLFELNLEKHGELEKTFATLDVTKIEEEISSIFKKKLNPDTDLLFFDEIQATPSAISALRYFYEERPQQALIAAGSLLDWELRNTQMPMPVGRITMGTLTPLSFSEFLEAMNEDFLLEKIKSWVPGKDFSQTAHLELVKLQRFYYFSGGFPEIVETFAKERDPHTISAILENIMQTYRFDFPKYAGRSVADRLYSVLEGCAPVIGQKIVYQTIAPGISSQTTKSDIERLVSARLLSKIPFTKATGLPLGASTDIHIYKIIFIDLGILNSILGLRYSTIQKMDERKLINEGPLAEQFVGQELLAQGHSPYFWMRGGKMGNAELDYLISIGESIVPIEVKAGASGRLRSLHEFLKEKKDIPLAIRTNLSPPALESLETGIKKVPLLSLPTYMTSEIQRLAEKFLD